MREGLVASPADDCGNRLGHEEREGTLDRLRDRYELGHVELAFALLETADRRSVQCDCGTKLCLGHAGEFASVRNPLAEKLLVHVCDFRTCELRCQRLHATNGRTAGENSAVGDN